MTVHTLIATITLYSSVAFSPTAFAWNMPGHMLSASIAFQVLRQESPSVILNTSNLLAKHPWFANRWQSRLMQVAPSERDHLLFMLTARWPDDGRGTSFHRSTWHYINVPFKPENEPNYVQAQPASTSNIPTALKDNSTILRNEPDPSAKAVALAWLFHIVGDVHQPLHTVALFTREYPDGDRGGNEFCIRPTLNSAKMNLHKFWDDMLTRTDNYTTLRNFATALKNRPGLAKDKLSELGPTDFDTWIKESFAAALTGLTRTARFVELLKGTQTTAPICRLSRCCQPAISRLRNTSLTGEW
jgi:hypothetical protein